MLILKKLLVIRRKLR